MHHSHTYLMLRENQGSWIFQCPIMLQSCICQVLWVRQFQVETFWVRGFHAAISRYSSMSLKLLIPSFPPDSHHFMSWLEGGKNPSLTKEWSDWQPQFFSSVCSSSLSPLLFFFPTLPVIRSQSASLCSPFLSPSLFLSLGIIFWLSRCALSFVSTLFFSAYSLNLSCLCPPPTIFCSRTVLHGQFTQSATHSPFSPQALNTIFKHKTPKVEKLKKESETELERENKRPCRKKRTWGKRRKNFKSIFCSVAWSDGGVHGNTEGYMCTFDMVRFVRSLPLSHSETQAQILGSWRHCHSNRV